jgi:O-antigen ligase
MLFLVTLKGLGAGKKILILVGLAVVLSITMFLASQVGVLDVWEQRMEGDTLEGSQESRLYKWERAVVVGIQRPVIGVGQGQEVVAYRRAGLGGKGSHNDVLTPLVVAGIPGFILFLAFLIVSMISYWKMPPGNLRSAMVGMWFAITFAGLFTTGWNKKILWVIAGIGAAAVVYYRDREKELAAYSQWYQVPPESMGLQHYGPQTAY